MARGPDVRAALIASPATTDARESGFDGSRGGAKIWLRLDYSSGRSRDRQGRSEPIQDRDHAPSNEFVTACSASSASSPRATECSSLTFRGPVRILLRLVEARVATQGLGNQGTH